MSVYGGDSWAREAQHRKRRVDDLIIEGVDASVYKKLSSGKFACLVCPHNPVLDTPTTLSTHVNGSRHRVAELRRRDRELSIQDEVAKRMALAGDVNGGIAGSASSKQRKMANKPLIERARKAASEALSGDFLRKEVNSKVNVSVMPHGEDFVCKVDGFKMEAECEGVVRDVVLLDYRERLEKELKFTAAGWKRDGYGRWFRDENMFGRGLRGGPGGRRGKNPVVQKPSRVENRNVTQSSRKRNTDMRENAARSMPDRVLDRSVTDEDEMPFMPSPHRQSEDSSSDETEGTDATETETNISLNANRPRHGMGKGFMGSHRFDASVDVDEEETNDDTLLRDRQAMMHHHGRRHSDGSGEGSSRGEDDGGPKNYELLISFKHHVASFIWSGSLDRGTLNCQSRASRLRSQSRDSKFSIPHTRTSVLRWLDQSRLYHLKDCMFEHLDMPLISAFVERWQPETNTFHLPFGEMTITLHDVWYLLRIPVTGAPVITTQDNGSYLGSMALLMGRTNDENFQRQIGWKYGKCKLEALETRLQLAADVPDESLYTGYLLWLLGCTLFCSKQSWATQANFLEFLEDSQKVSTYAWGAATLANMYRQLGEASRAECKEFAGCMTLIQAWIYEYFPSLRCSKRMDIDADDPFACRWLPLQVKQSMHSGLLQTYRATLDNMTTTQVNWLPFGAKPQNDVPITLYRGIIHCQSVCEPYMPDRVLRQFGFVQVIPMQPIRPIKAVRVENPRKYILKHFFDDLQFVHWRNNMYNIGFSVPDSRCIAVNEYLGWYLARTHPRVSKDSIHDADTNPDSHTSQYDDLIKRLKGIALPFHPDLNPQPNYDDVVAAMQDMAVTLVQWNAGRGK